MEAEEPIRGPDGLCIECAHGETGELLSPIVESRPETAFSGYTDSKSTNSKILRDVKKKGDMYFRSGDLLMRDSNGYFFFMDRIGDTFRWKGENVSTTEVSEAVSTFENILEANVYGVAVPGKDGRACMAAITLNEPHHPDQIDWPKFKEHVKKNLPSYAQPIWVRILPQMQVTGTFKHQKVELRKQGMDLNLVQDPIFWLDPNTDSYVPFTRQALQSILSKTSKL